MCVTISMTEFPIYKICKTATKVPSGFHVQEWFVVIKLFPGIDQIVNINKCFVRMFAICIRKLELNKNTIQKNTASEKYNSSNEDFERNNNGIENNLNIIQRDWRLKEQ